MVQARPGLAGMSRAGKGAQERNTALGMNLLPFHLCITSPHPSSVVPEFSHRSPAQGQDRGDAAGRWRQAGRGSRGGVASWPAPPSPPPASCLLNPKGSSEVPLGTKPPLSHRTGGFVLLHCPAEARSSPWAQAVSVFAFQGATLPTTSSWAARSSTPLIPRDTSSERTATSTSWGTGPWWWALGTRGWGDTDVPLPKGIVTACVCHGVRLLAVTAQGQNQPSTPGVAQVDSLMSNMRVGCLLQPVLHWALTQVCLHPLHSNVIVKLKPDLC